jgi:hypothetical protein
MSDQKLNTDTNTNNLDTKNLDTKNLDTNILDTNTLDTNKLDTNDPDTKILDTKILDTNTLDTNKLDTNKLDTKILDNKTSLLFEKIKKTLQNEINEYQEYLLKIKSDPNGELYFDLEHFGINKQYNLDLDQLTDEKKKSIRLDYRSSDVVFMKKMLESKEYSMSQTITSRLLKNLEIPEFVELLNIMCEGRDVFGSNTTTMSLTDDFYDEIEDVFKSNERLTEFSKIISASSDTKINDDNNNNNNNKNNKDSLDEKYLNSLKKLTPKDWFLASIAKMSIKPILYLALEDALLPKDIDDPAKINLLFVKTNRVKMLLEHVPFDVWICSWHNSMTPLQYLTHLVSSKSFVQNIYLKKQLFQIIMHFKKYIGDKHQFRFIRPLQVTLTPTGRQNMNVLAPLPMYFKENTVGVCFRDMDNWTWLENCTD